MTTGHIMPASRMGRHAALRALGTLGAAALSGGATTSLTRLLVAPAHAASQLAESVPSTDLIAPVLADAGFGPAAQGEIPAAEEKPALRAVLGDAGRGFLIFNEHAQHYLFMSDEDLDALYPLLRDGTLVKVSNPKRVVYVRFGESVAALTDRHYVDGEALSTKRGYGSFLVPSYMTLDGEAYGPLEAGVVSVAVNDNDDVLFEFSLYDNFEALLDAPGPSSPLIQTMVDPNLNLRQFRLDAVAHWIGRAVASVAQNGGVGFPDLPRPEFGMLTDATRFRLM